jgi:hypothetical protein
MSKLFVRITVLIVALYTIVCHLFAVVWQTNLWLHSYTVLFEICVCLCISAQGKYHCKYLKWTAYAITFNDTLISLDEAFDFIPYHVAIIIPFIIITCGLLTTTILSIMHFVKVKRLKRIWRVNHPS